MYKQGLAIKHILDYANNHSKFIQFCQALSYAHSKGGVIDEGGTRKVLPKNFKLVQEYLKQGEDVAMILNNMGTICAELKDFEKAKQYFSEAIELIPDGSGYKDPYLGLEAIKDSQST